MTEDKFRGLNAPCTNLLCNKIGFLGFFNSIAFEQQGGIKGVLSGLRPINVICGVDKDAGVVLDAVEYATQGSCFHKINVTVEINLSQALFDWGVEQKALNARRDPKSKIASSDFLLRKSAFFSLSKGRQTYFKNNDNSGFRTTANFVVKDTSSRDPFYSWDRTYALGNLASRYLDYFGFQRLRFHRVLSPEAYKMNESNEIKSDGTGAARFLHFLACDDSERGRAFKNVVLNALNEIFDGRKFNDLIPFREKYDVFLVDESGQNSLDQCASVVKEVLLTLSCLLSPSYYGIDECKTIIYGLESVGIGLSDYQERLLQFIARHAAETGKVVFLTTQNPATYKFLKQQESAQAFTIDDICQ